MASAISAAALSRTARRRGGVLEQEILRSLGAAGHPLTPGELRSALGGDPALTTVATTLIRLHAKGALCRVRAGRGYAYAVVGDVATVGAAITARTMCRLLQAGGDRSGVLAGFVAVLGPTERQTLATLLAGRTSGPVTVETCVPALP